MTYVATRQKALHRGVPTAAFLGELVALLRLADPEIFFPNAHDYVYSSVPTSLGSWHGLSHERATMLEAMRVLAGFE